MLVCPDCGAATLEIVEKIELGADERSDEHDLQLLKCSSCGMNAIGEYEESRRGPLDEDRFHHTGFRIDAKAMQTLRRAVSEEPKETLYQVFQSHMNWSMRFAIEYRRN